MSLSLAWLRMLPEKNVVITNEMEQILIIIDF